jgi:hypothetical protein
MAVYCPAIRKEALIAGTALFLAAGLLGGVWAWENAGREGVCERFREVVFDGPGGHPYPTIELALARFSRFPGVRGQLPPGSLIPTDDVAPTFGATINRDSHGDINRERTYDIWKGGMVVQHVYVDRRRGGWGVTGYGGCDPIP